MVRHTSGIQPTQKGYFCPILIMQSTVTSHPSSVNSHRACTLSSTWAGLASPVSLFSFHLYYLSRSLFSHSKWHGGDLLWDSWREAVALVQLALCSIDGLRRWWPQLTSAAVGILPAPKNNIFNCEHQNRVLHPSLKIHFYRPKNFFMY